MLIYIFNVLGAVYLTISFLFMFLFTGVFQDLAPKALKGELTLGIVASAYALTAVMDLGLRLKANYEGEPLRDALLSDEDGATFLSLPYWISCVPGVVLIFLGYTHYLK